MKKFRKMMSFVVCFCLAVFITPTFVNAATVEVSTEDELVGALEIGNSVVLKNDITITKSSTSTNTTTSRTKGAVILANDDITVDGAGFRITTSAVNVLFEVNNVTKTKVSNVTFKNITLENTKSASVSGQSRVIDTRSGKITLNLDDVTITMGTKDGNNKQALTIGGNTNGEVITVNIKDSSIDATTVGYGIITFNPVNMNITNSEVKGYSALYMRDDANSGGSEGSIVTVKDSTLSSKNEASEHETNSFGTIVLDDKNVTINVEDSTIKAEKNNNMQTVFGATTAVLDSEGKITSQITVKGDSEIIAPSMDEVISELVNEQTQETTKIINLEISGGVKSSVEIKDDYIAEGYEVVTRDDGSKEVIYSGSNNVQTYDGIINYVVLAFLSLIVLVRLRKKLFN